jgi:periplasmic divalent cation tolerance protein
MPRRDPRIALVLTTCPTRAAAHALARQLVRQQAAACANVVPGIVSYFWWEGKIDRSREALLLLKTTAAGVERLRRAIIDLHPYEVPEVIALPVDAAHGPYGRWVAESIRQP